MGIDKTPSETLKNPTVICALHDLFVRCFHEGVTPKDWSKSIICPIPKSAGFQSNDPLQYRGISIAPAICKIYTYVLNRRLTQWMEDNNKLSDCQNGFRRGRSTIDHLTTLPSIVECRKSQRKATYAAFIELVDRQKLRYKLRATGVKGKFYNSIISPYNNTMSCVKVGEHFTAWFKVDRGLRQGCNLSPALFNLFINDLTDTIHGIDSGIQCGGVQVPILMYADSEEKLQEMLKALYIFCDEWGLEIINAKFAVIHFRSHIPAVNIIFSVVMKMWT